ncbi:hypothetical protein [Trujillonella humicola]|uniref:hypothetical protein n=1 Tax=Trujillonella humicola TaxID=3383699 RepID=UPI00390599BC
MTRWSITHLDDMPTLAVGDDADLKFDDGQTRVWLRRSRSGGGHDGATVLVEKLQADHTWKRVD